MHPVALALEEADDARQHVIVATDAEADEEGQVADGAEIESDIRGIGARHAADDDEIAAASAVERCEQLADLAPLDPGMRETLDLLAGLAANADNMQIEPAGSGRVGDQARKQTAPGNDAERAFYPSTVTRVARDAVMGLALRHCWARRTSAPIGF